MVQRIHGELIMGQQDWNHISIQNIGYDILSLALAVLEVDLAGDKLEMLI